jgi:hypothetical protein
VADPDFPNGLLPTGMEIAFGANLQGDQDAWPWSDVTDALMNQSATVTRGRQDESSDVAPTSASANLDNPDGDLTPDNAMGANYPNVTLGTPDRWWLEAGLPRLYVRPTWPNSAEVNSSASLDLTSDLDVRIDMHLKTMDPSGTGAVVAGRADSAGSFSWRIKVNPNRTVTLQWSATGTPPPLEITSLNPVVPMSARATLRVTLDVNNGAGGRTATFYVGESVTGPFTQVGAAVTQAGATSIFDAVEPLVVGTATDLSTAYAPDMSVYAFQLLDGIGGTALADADFTAQPSGSTFFVDDAGQTWTMFGAELTNKWFRIVGTIDSWAPNWPYGDLSAQQDGGLGVGEARVDIEIAGILRRLGQGATPLDSAVRRYDQSQTALRAYWPMEDLIESTQIASAVDGGLAMAVGGLVDFAADDTLVGSRALVTLSPTSYLSGAITGSFAGNWTVDWYLHIEAAPAATTRIMSIVSTGTVAQWNIDLTPTQVIVTGVDSVGATVSTATGANTGLIGTDWRNLRMMARQTGTTVTWLFVWIPVTYPATSGSSVTNSFTGSVGAPSIATVPPSAGLNGLGMGHLAVLDTYAGTAAVNAGTGWTGDTAAARMLRLCQEEGISFRLIGEPSTTALVGPQQIATLLELLNAAADADGGILYEQPDAVGLIYRTRESLYNQPPSMVLDGLLQQIQNAFTPILDDQRIRNDVTVTRTGGSSARVTDDVSIAQNGRYGESVTLDLYADSQILDVAGWRLHQGTVEGMRYAQLLTNLGVAPEIIDAWLTVDIGSRVRATNLPPQLTTNDVNVMVEGYTEGFSPTTWEPTMNCSPSSVWDVGQLDGEGVAEDFLLRLETDGSELAFAITDVATTMFVEVTAGPAWTDDNAETPFDLNVGGERMTVTDIDPPTGGAAYTGAGSAALTASVSHVAPSVVAPGTTDLLICAWSSFSSAGAYTVPGTMTLGASSSGVLSTCANATQVLAAAGATGTRTATFAPSNKYSAISLVVHSALGTPSIDDFQSGVSIQDLTLTTGISVPAGSWLLAINAWNYDPGNNMGPPSGTGWALVADSILASSLTSRIRAWAKRVTSADAGVQSVTFYDSAGIDDNHCRLYVLSNVTGVTQEFTVTRSINSVVKPHAAGTSVGLWFKPVLAR